MDVKTENFNMTQIGVVHSCYKQKFGIPRTSNLAASAKASVELFNPWGVEEALRDLTGISHIWLIFKFHKNNKKSWSPTVRPPRMGGNKQISVFASRSPIRPNPLGMSVVNYLGYTLVKGGRAFLDVSGIDLLDGTPIYDIKPYVNESDKIKNACQGWIDTQIFAPVVEVVFTSESDSLCKNHSKKYPHLKSLIKQVISLDPRPAYKRDDGQWGVLLYEFNIKWRMQGKKAEVFEIARLC